MARLVGEIRVRFGDSAECEWALETTTSSIEPGTPSTLRDVGFGRIHLGIQTLDDGVRRRIRRRESGRAALAKIAALQRAGFLVSVDLIIGFKGVTDAVVREDLRLLFDAGIRTFSICELRTLLSARSGTEPAARAAESNFRTWSLIWRFMERHGLIPIHVGQFATRSQDNLYYTHPARGEDCVAIGPYAHGSTGPLYYGNLLLPEYYEALQRGSAPVASGVLYDDAAQLIRALERDLLGHRLPRDTVRAVSSTYGPSFQRLLATWIEQRLLLAGPAEEPYRLTMQGSWFVGNMVGQARRLVSAGRPGPRQFRNVRQQVFASTGGGE